MIKRLVLGLLLGIIGVLIPCFANGMVIWKGTGEFINQNGDILTANHVLHNADTLNVEYQGKMYRAYITAIDAKNDLAIIHINVQNDYAFSLANEPPSVGDKIIIIGFPATTNKLTITSGDVIEVSNYTFIQNNKKYLVCGGNSGGAAINNQGQLMGVVDRSITSREDRCGNIGMTVPLSIIKNFLFVNRIEAVPSLNTAINPNQILGGIIKKGGIVQIINFNWDDLPKSPNKSK